MRNSVLPELSWRCRRVRKRSEYVRIQKLGRRISTEHFVLILQTRAPKDPEAGGIEACRLGITMSSRFGNAVRRNRAKRLAREAFRALQAELPSHSDLVVIGKKDDPELNLAQVISEWREALFSRSRAPGRAPGRPRSRPEGSS